MDFKNSDIANGPVLTDFAGAEAAVALEAAAVLAVAMQGGNILPLTADGQLVLPAGVGLDDIKVVGRNLVIQMPDGTQMIVPDGAVFVPEIVVDGVAVPPLNIAALLVGQEPQPAAGRQQSSGGNFADPVGDIGDPFALGDLLPPTQLAFPEPEEREIIPQLEDEEPTTIIITPDQPAGSVSATASVNEAALPARGSEPPGSNEASNAETTTGTIVFDAPDGLASITLNGVAITAVGQVFVTPLGRLTITSIAPGSIGYSYTLTDNTTNPSSNDVFAVVVTDSDGDTASANLTINIVDDAPTARNDTDSVPAANYSGQTGNVITGAGTTSGNAGADTQGADGAVLTGIRAGTATGTFAAAGTTINGQYGTLTISADGSYTYTRNAGTPGGVNDVFTYQLTDGDGDTSTATLTISIGDSPVTITSVPVAGAAGTVVDEAGLPARGTEPPGSNAAAPSESTSGTITFTAPDGVASVAINGVNITGAGQVITVPTGTLLITGYNPATGTLAYTFTLTDNTSGDATTQVFTITVTDTDGDTASSPFTVRIIDDVPTAVADTDSIAAGSYGPATGNVITDSEGDGGKDVQGADGVTVTNVAGAGGSGAAGTAVNGLYGVLTLNADGSYSYVRNAGSPGGVSDVFTYTITDGDGDTSTTTLTIAIADSPVTLTLPVKGAAGTSVDEAGLPAGSNAPADSEKTNGTINYVAADGPATVTIDGVAVTAVGQTFTGSFGTLKITSIANGVIGYEYLLTTNTSGDATFDDFAIVVTDQDGDSSNGTLVIDIVDDVPTARPDVDSVTEDDFGVDSETVSADGNVITGVGGSDANSTDGVADTRGADGASVTAVAFGATAGAVGGSTAGEYGTLTLNADGSYSYILNNFDPRIQGLDSDETLTEVFTYTITDGDGDARTTTLTITINGSDDPITINGLNIQGPELVVDDDDLPDGSSPNAPALTKTGSFTVNGVDGIASIKIDGVEVFVGQTIVTASGTFTITAISAPANGNATGITVSYSFTLNSNTAHPNGGGENSITESFQVTVTDTDGSTDTDTIDVLIIDDVPTAVNDTDSIAAGQFGPAMGNVITDAEGDGGADTRGADGATVTAIVGAAAGTVGGTTAGLYGVLTLNADGSYGYVRNAGTPGGVSDIFTYTITDGDGDTSTATLTIAIADAQPVAGQNAAVLLDDDALAGGNAGGTGDDVDAANLTGTLAASGGDGPLSWAYQTSGAPAGFTYVANGSGIDIFQGTTKVLAITLNTATGAYTVTQLAPIVHAPGSDENNQGFTISYNVTDTDGDASSGTLTINVDDDTPTAANDVDEILSGSAAPATGNVITDAEGDGGADSVGADGGAAIVAITGFGGAGIVGGVTNGQYGVLTINADGSYSYVRNGGTPGNVEDVFTYTLTDADGDTVTATLTISIEDARPITGLNAVVLLDDDALAGGNAGGTGDDADAANLTGTLAGSGGDGALTWAYQTSGNPAGFTYVANGTGIDVFQGTTKVLVITLNSATGAYTVAQVAPISHANGGDENNQIFTINYTVTDADGDVAPGTLTIDVDDDSPTATDDGRVTIEGAPAVTGNVLSNDSVGADVPGAVTLVGATAIGVNTVIVGTYGTLTISSNGGYSYVPNASVPSGSIDSFAYTMRDADGDTATATLTFTFNGDANRPTAGTTTASVDDDALAGNAGGTGDLPDPNTDGDNNQATFSGTLPLNFGLDGAGKVSFANLHNLFVIVGTESVQLSWNEAASTLTGTGPRGVLFTVVVNQATGAYTFTLLDNVLHNGGGNENDATAVLTYLVTDSDGSAVPGTLTVTFDDDTPVAVSDVDSVSEDGPSTADGNVFTGNGGSDANATDGSADSIGADGTGPSGAVTAVAFGATAGTLGSALNGAYGALTLNANGSYSYALNNALAAVQGLDTGETLTEIFTYTITDADGDSTTATLTITINGTNDAPVVGTGTAVVSEEGLANAIADSTGVSDTTNSATAGGTISIADVDGETYIVTLGDPGAVLTADGLTVTWTGVGTGTLTGRVETSPGVFVNVITVTISNTGVYSVTLLQSVDHPTVNVEDIKSFIVPVNVSDGTVTVPTTLTVTIEDDSPLAANDSDSVTEDGALTADGNVLTGIGGSDANITDGVADGTGADTPASVTAVAFGATAGTLGAGLAGAYGTLTLNANGSYSYALNNALASVQGLDSGEILTETFTYTIRDSDGDTSVATLVITINGANDAPTLGTATVSVSEEGLTGANPDTSGAPDTTNVKTIGGTIAVGDVDGEPLTVTLGNPGAVLTADGLAVTWTGVGTGTLIGSVGLVEVIRVTIDNSGNFVVTLSQSIDHPLMNVEDLKTFTVPVTVSDGTTSTTNPTALTINIEDDSPIITSASNVVLTGSNLSVTGNFDYEIGADSRPAITTVNGDFTSVLLTGLVGSAAITNVVVTKTSETGTAANYTFSFQYDSDPSTPGVQTATSTGSLVFNKSGTYTITLNQPIATFTTVTTSGTIGTPESYNLVGSAASQPEIVVSQLGTNFFVRFTGVDDNVNAGGNGSFVAGETFGGTQGWVSITGNENGVSSDTLQNGEVLNLDFYTASPGGAVAPGPGTARADTVFLKLAQLGNSEDMVVLLKLVDPDDGSITTRVVVVDAGDIWKPADGANPYGISYVGADGVIIIESNDYNFGTENYQIYGMQLLTSTNGVTLGAGNNAIDLNRNTGATGFSTFNDNFTGTDDNDVIKIVDIGFVQRTTNTQVLKLNIDVVVTDSDGDTAMQLLTVNGGVPVAPLAPLMLGGTQTALPGGTMLFAVEQEQETAAQQSFAATAPSGQSRFSLQMATETAAPMAVSLAANDKSAELLRTTTNVTATVIAASLVGLPAISDVLAAPAPDASRLAMLPGQETAMPELVGLVGEIGNVAGVGDAVLSMDVETTRITADDYSSLRAADYDDAVATLDIRPASPLSDGLIGGADAIDIADILPAASPVAADAVLHNILDLAAASLTDGSNDNPARLAIENVVDEALPDSMIDRLVEAFEADLEVPVISGEGVADSSGYLVELINQSVSNSRDSVNIHVDPFGSQFHDMATINNG
jgi:VCBS repeat-containing protein